MKHHLPPYTQAYYHKKKYSNVVGERKHGFFFHSCIMFFRSFYRRARRKKLPIHAYIDNSFSNQNPSDFSITWIGHSTFLIKLKGITILTDPIFGNASALFKRILPPGIDIESLRSINYVLISHNHRDHMDGPSLMRLRHHNPVVMVPQGDKKWFMRRSFRFVQEKIWWQSSTFYHANEPITFTFLPAHHWSQRALFDRNKSLWGSWMIQYNDKTIYFAGDTAYASHFGAIREKFPKIDSALLPIAPCQPRAALQHTHLDAREAVQAFKDLDAHHFIPMHWGTFYFGIDHYHHPIEELINAWQKDEKVLADKKLHILKIGQSLDSDNETQENVKPLVEDYSSSTTTA